MSKHNSAHAYSKLKDKAGFSVSIEWTGPEDKPFYRALLVSASQSSLIENKPFWGYAIISVEEFNRLLEVLESNDLPLLPGHHSGAAPEYYVEVQASDETYHCSLGFDRQTINVLNQMADQLETANQKPIRDIIARSSPRL